MDTAVKPQGCTNLKLRQLNRRVSQLYDRTLAECGLKTTQYSLLSNVLRLAPVVETVTLDAPRLRLVHLGGGKYDIDDILARLDKPAPDFGPLHSRFAALEGSRSL